MKLINTKSIAILLGVYNGSEYLAEQLDSIINQTNQDWTIYIRDDSSTDNSLDVISRYCKQYSNFVLIEDTKGNLKSRDNFFELLQRVDSDYYMFCDHDDIWLSNKIEVTHKKMKFRELENEDKPILVFTDLKVVNSHLNELSSSFWRYSGINPYVNKNFNYMSVYSLTTGCTVMINKEAYLKSLPVSDLATMHDSWVTLKTIASGGIVDFVDEATILYRQHGNNVLGANQVNSKYFFNKIKLIKKVIVLNKHNFYMINSIKKTSILKYIYFKLTYYLKR